MPKRLLALLLTLTMVVSLMPVAAFAEEPLALAEEPAAVSEEVLPVEETPDQQEESQIPAEETPAPEQETPEAPEETPVETEEPAPEEQPAEIEDTLTETPEEIPEETPADTEETPEETEDPEEVLEEGSVSAYLAGVDDSFGAIYFKDGLGQESNITYISNALQASDQVALYSKMSAQGKTLVILLNQDWSTTDFVYSTTNDVEVDLNGCTWNVTGSGSKGLVTSKNVSVHNGMVNVTNASQPLVQVTSAQLDLHDLTITGKFNNCTAVKLAHEGAIAFQWFRIQRVNFINIQSSGSHGACLELTVDSLVGHPGTTNDIIEDCVFSNVSGAAYGAVYLPASNCNVQFDRCTFARGQSTNGAAIYMGGSGNTVVLENCNLNDCRANTNGGAIFMNGSGSTLRLNNTIIAYCRAEKGGGIFMNGSNNMVIGNTSGNQQLSAIIQCIANDDGGAIYMNGRGSSVSQLNMNRNHAMDVGGAIYISGTAATSMVSDCHFEENISKNEGGAIRCQDKNNTGIHNNVFVKNETDKRKSTDLWMDGSDSNAKQNTFYSTYSQSTVCNKGIWGDSRNNKLYNSWDANEPWDGSGSAEDPYLIQSAEDLILLADRVSGAHSNYKGVYFRQTVDIKNFTRTISYYGVDFSGIYDGYGHSIELNYTREDSASLFGALRGATVTDLTLTGKVTSFSTASALANHADQSVIRNVVNKATITGRRGTAGLVSEASASRFENCANEGAVTATGKPDPETIYAAGIAATYGKAPVDENGKVLPAFSNCTNNAPITGSDWVSGIANFADIFHSHDLTVFELQLEHCRNTGRITSEGDYAGGITAGLPSSDDPWTFTISNCRNYGAVSGKVYVGGIIGRASSAVVKECVNLGDIRLEPFSSTGFLPFNYAGGILGYSNQANEKAPILLVDHCTNSGNLYCSGDTAFHVVGGIVGTSYGTIRNCVSSGSMMATNADQRAVGGGILGGILQAKTVGSAADCVVENCYSRVTFGGVWNAPGALVGNASSGKHLSHSVYQGDADLELVGYLTAPFQTIDNRTISLNADATAINALVTTMNDHQNPDWMQWKADANNRLTLTNGSKCTVTFDYNYKGSPAAVNVVVESGTAVARPNISRSGYTIEWYRDAICSTAAKWDFEKDVVDEDTVLYANWKCNHTKAQKIAGKAATESAAGYKDCWYCSNCQVYFTDEELTKPLGGLLSLDMWRKMGEGLLAQKKSTYLEKYSAGELADKPIADRPVSALDAGMTKWGEKGSTVWYLVSEDLTFNSSVNVYGTVHLIIKDNCTVTINGCLQLDEGATFNLYGQSVWSGSGRLIVNATNTLVAAVRPINLMKKATVNIYSGDFSAQGCNRLDNAYSQYISLNFDLNHHVMLDGSDEDSAMVNIVPGMELTYMGSRYIRLIPVTTGDLSAFKNFIENELPGMVDEIGTVVDSVVGEIDKIPGLIDGLGTIISDTNEMISEAKSMLTEAKSLMKKGKSIIDGVGKLLPWNWFDPPEEDEPNHMIVVNQNGVKAIHLVGAGDDLGEPHPLLTIRRTNIPNQNVPQIMDVGDRIVITAEDISVQVKNKNGYKTYPGKVKLGFELTNLAYWQARGELAMYHLRSDGEVEQLPLTINKENGMVYVTTDSCSPFVLVVEPKDPPKPLPPVTPVEKDDDATVTVTVVPNQRPTSPKTGDNAPAVVLLTLLAALTLAGTVVGKKKQ